MKVERMNLASLKAFFGKLVRMSFYDLGMEKDTQIASYLTDVLADFAETERLYRISNSEGKRVETVVEMLLETQSGSDEISNYEREMRKYVGDFTLFMTGIFRDYIVRGSYLRYYINVGTKSYFLVSKFDIKTGKGNPIMFSKLSNDFEFYSGALDYMRKVYFQTEMSGDPFSNFIIQISKGIRH
ncbi:MAG: hypothetical protein C4291_09620 [Candidatus Dadabacteria bacterium]